ncbi:MAG: glycosyltransferase family 2 protein [Acidobacteriota bacterium]
MSGNCPAPAPGQVKNATGATQRVSLVVPVFNEEDNLERLHVEVRQAMETTGLPWELILVNDGSTDASAVVLDRLVAADSRLRVLHMETRSGQTGALAAGFAAARGDVVVTLDGDLQNDPADIPRLLQALSAAGAVVGWRRRRLDGWLRRLSSGIANWARNMVTGDRVKDTGCSLKAFRGEVVRGLLVSRGMHRFLPTLVRMRGYPVVEIPVNHRPRHAGQSKYGIANRLFVGLGDLFMIRWMKSRVLTYRVVREAGAGLPLAGDRYEEVRR